MKQKSESNVARNLFQLQQRPSAYYFIQHPLGFASFQAPSFVLRFPATVLPENFRTHTLVSYHPLTNNPISREHRSKTTQPDTSNRYNAPQSLSEQQRFQQQPPSFSLSL